MNKTISPRIRSFYHDVDEISEIKIEPSKTALLIMDMQNFHLGQIDEEMAKAKAESTYSRWKDFYDRMEYITLPAIQEILGKCRELGITVTYGAENHADDYDRAIIDSLKPLDGERVYIREKSSITTRTTYVDDLRDAGIDTVIVTGSATDHCVSSSIRALSDEDFKVLCVDEACAADSLEQHECELRAINICFCTVVSQMQLMDILG